MKNIILFTNMSSIRKHWHNALTNEYTQLPIEKFETLLHYLDKDNSDVTILFDEMSVSNIQKELQTLKKYPQATILLFNALPEVHHASSLLGSGIKGYENSYIAKNNLLSMLQSVDAGNTWLFADLTQFLINRLVDNSSKDEPEFMYKLTEKEKDTALMIADGLSNKAIAQNMKISLSTVKGHIHNIFEKVGVSDRVALALKFKSRPQAQ